MGSNVINKSNAASLERLFPMKGCRVYVRAKRLSTSGSRLSNQTHPRVSLRSYEQGLRDILVQSRNLVSDMWQPPLVILATVYITEIVQSSYERPAEVLIHKQLDDTRPFLR
jgi:hypothetical protein